jgi:hypothetical protein
MNRKLFIHCGFHKTGTTSLQRVLAEKTEALKSAGVLYPKTGRVNAVSGQHNVAWELTRDRRFQPWRGRLYELQAEIAGFEGDVILSSEDFESILLRPSCWTPMLDLAKALDLSPVLVIYLREQSDYLHSLYYQCLKIGLGEEYTLFLDEVMQHGAVVRREWAFHFDYHRVIEAAAALCDGRLIVRNYHAPEGPSVVTDFFHALGLPLEILDADDMDLRTHVRSPHADALEQFYRFRTPRPLEASEIEALANFTASLPPPAAPPDLVSRLRLRFGEDNLQLCARYALDPTGFQAAPPAGPPADRSNLARVFSLETQYNIQWIAAHLARVETEPDAANTAEERIGVLSTWACRW